MKPIDAIKVVLRAEMPAQAKVTCCSALLFGTIDRTILAKHSESLPDEVEVHFNAFSDATGKQFMQIYAAAQRSTARTQNVLGVEVVSGNVFATEVAAYYRTIYYNSFGTAVKITDQEFRILKRMSVTQTMETLKNRMLQFIALTKEPKYATVSYYVQHRKKESKLSLAAKKRAKKKRPKKG